jgi:valyl-tRNA synthetase
MPHDLPKAYDPAAIEEKWAEFWVKENLFAQPASEPGPKSSTDIRDPFTILLPPPNVTGRLHMGHMLNQTEMDILARWHRMKGEKTLWVPGTDHAGIATQMMVERQLATEGASRQSLGREAFEARVWQWRDQYGKAILDQMKRLGASVDWSREYFTMDAGLSTAVREAFTRLYHQGLIYRGAYVVNWCPGCQTAVSDLEVVHEEELGKLWEIRYPVAGSPDEFLTIATTRPETLLGDVAVAIHPEDERYLHLHGKTLLLPLCPTGLQREIPIVLDAWVSRDFGTGAVKITPAHDPNDFALGQRHNLPSINVMDPTAKINENGGVYQGLDRYAARKRILEDLEALGLLGKIHDHKLSVGRCDRSKDVIEPRLSTQWFVAVNKKPLNGRPTLAELATQAVQPGPEGKKPIQFTPAMYEKTYLNWMENIYDWCISRQLWWGHRIPAWHCAQCHQITVPEPGVASDPTACAHCQSPELTQETDVLDTWFSSGLLPVSVFGWPFLKNAGAPGLDFETGEGSPDFQTFYPTTLLVTGFDILFFWVARMIMLGCWFAGDVPLPDGTKRSLAESVPFRNVYIHALVRDANREKMSKTKGNVIDPIEIVKQYGTDAVRFTLASMASPGTDIAFNVARTEGYRAFANKIWNAARFLFMNIDRAAEIGITVDPAVLGGMPSFITEKPASQGFVKGHDFSRAENANPLDGALAPEVNAPLEARWIVAQFHETAAEVNQSLANYRYDDAANAIYQFFWGSFCDWYLEIVKIRLDFSEAADKAATKAALTTFVSVFEASLRLLSPFMPFLTEEIWQAVYEGKTPTKSVALASYPNPIPAEYSASHYYNHAVVEMSAVQRIVTAFRSLRKDSGVPDKETVAGHVYSDGKNGVLTIGCVNGNETIIRSLAKLSSVIYETQPLPSSNRRSETDFDLSIDYEAAIDIPAERERLTKEIAKLEKNITGAEKQLGNEAFLAKAPPAIVEGLKKQEAENRLLLEKAKAALAALPPE